MGDSEAVVADSSATMDYASAAYNSVGSGAYSSQATGYPTAPGGHPNSAGQEGQSSAMHDGKPAGGSTDETAVAVGNTVADASKAVGCNYPLNGNVVNTAGNATTVENGNAFDNLGGASAAPEFMDGSAPTMSAEKERLWSILRANSLDFNAWTSLIEETEKVAEVMNLSSLMFYLSLRLLSAIEFSSVHMQNNILKIRKVYDAFLAEFPLCYGYWKKYADHEARIGSMDKVVEVYERAAQGVTYSVDIWGAILCFCH
ncbi:hypothetical protein CXB51_014353 [Gossypium anomalum]|uniref:Pre-mRNA-processing factor 39 n=1 Tax=Gossypium anomalum TaxID=47600 RepID=A0A8J5YJY2_9ROSI|nr:hypothetical protein CXB51_014353 [Gossypium anomalum]